MKLILNKNNSKLILKESTREEYNQLKLSLSPYTKNYRFSPAFKFRNWDGKIDFFNNGNIDFGLWSEVYNICKEYSYPFQIINKDQFPRDNDITLEKVKNFCKEFYKDYKVKGESFIPYEHQIDAVFKMLKHKFLSVEIATSGGKTLTFATFCFYVLKKINPNAKILLVVINQTLCNQFYDDFLDYNLGFNKENKDPLELNIMEIMSDHPRKVRDGKEPNIYIGTYQSLINYPEEFFKQFNIVCADEGHRAPGASIQTIMKRTFNFADYRMCMSGSFPNQGTSELLSILSVTGPIVSKVRAKDLMDKGLISNVKIKALILQYEDKSFAENIYNIKRLGQGKKAYDLEKQYTQKSEKRKYFINKLVNKFKDNSLVLFFNIDYGTELYDFFRSNITDKDFYYIDGNTSAEKRNYIKKQLEITDGKPKILVGSYGCISTGISIKALTNVVFADSFKSPLLILQSIGRSLRLHSEKNHAIIFDIVDKFHSNYKNTLYMHYISRKKEVYDKQKFENSEIKITL